MFAGVERLKVMTLKIENGREEPFSLLEDLDEQKAAILAD